jgi:tetratricopeptide (TPR) repeat protein
MNKLLVTTLSFILSGTCIFAQTTGFKQATTDHYKIVSEVSEEHAQSIALKMEAALAYFNQLLHFDLTRLTTKFRVTIYKEKATFDTYLKKVLGLERDDYVYIHYSDANKCELVGFDKSDEADLNISLLHQGFIQFIKAFIPNVPIWISDGLAAYLENGTFASSEAGGTFALNVNLGMLDALKAIIKGDEEKKLIQMEDFLTIDRAQALASIDVFYPQAWGFIYFLLMSPSKNHTRILWDAISDIDHTLSVKDNSILVKNRMFLWIAKDTLEKDFTDFVLASKTFNDLLTEGLALYNNNNLADAKKDFLKASELKPAHYFPQYYLGLIAYDQKDYDTAGIYYEKARELGMDSGLINYALGVNAYAANKYDDAIKYLTDASVADSAKYGDKTDALLKQIQEEITINEAGAEADTATEKPAEEKTPEPSVSPTLAPSPRPTIAPTPEPTMEPIPAE